MYINIFFYLECPNLRFPLYKTETALVFANSSNNINNYIYYNKQNKHRT